jgi:hypothetical protein
MNKIFEFLIIFSTLMLITNISNENFDLYLKSIYGKITITFLILVFSLNNKILDLITLLLWIILYKICFY